MKKIYIPLLLSITIAPLHAIKFLDNLFGTSKEKKEEEKKDEQNVSEQNASEKKSEEVKPESPVHAEEVKPLEEVAKEKSEPKKEEQKPVETKAEAAPVAKASELPSGFDASRGFANVVEKALPAVVNVATTQVVGDTKEDMQDFQGGVPGLQGSPFEDLFKKFMDQGGNKPRKVQSLGSGFIIKADDKAFYVVTNYHVVQDAKKIKIFMDSKTEVEGKLHASDERTDLAVIKVMLDSLPKEKRNVTVLEWGDQEASRVGDWVIAIGNPFGFGSSVTVGVLSHKGRDTVARGMGRLSEYVDDYIQHSAQINFGNSGGCLLSTSGKVIGVNTAIISPSGGNVGIGFAIPAHIAKVTIKQLIDFGRTKRGWLGVKIQPFTEEMAESIGQKSFLANKPIVMSVTPDGPAEKAGIQKEDIILEFNGKPLDGQSRLFRLVGETPVGTSVPVKVWRKGGKEVIVKVTVGEYEDAEQKGQIDENPKIETPSDQGKVQEIIGLTLAPLTNQLKDRLRVQDKNLKGGVVVLKVDPAKAAEVGLMRGDIIVEINQKEISTPKDVLDVVESARKAGHKNVLLLIMRNNGEPHYISVKIVDEDLDETPKKQEKIEENTDNKKPKTESPKTDEGSTEHPGNKPKAVM